MIMSDEESAADKAISVSIARQPVFDEKRRLWGYALFCVGQTGPLSSAPSETDGVAISVASSAYMGLQQIVERGQKVLISFSEKSILKQLPYALPPELTVVQVTPELFEKPAMPEALAQLKSDGYSLSVLGFSHAEGLKALYAMADVIGLDVQGLTRPVLTDVAGRAQEYQAGLLAMQVQDGAQFVMCRDLGFSLFHGAFFKRPDTIQVRQLTSNEVARFNLLHMLEQEVPDFDQLAEIIQSDVSISFRLLAYLNSAAFGLRQKITSIRQAISLLGWRKIKNWLRVVLLNDMSQKAETPELMAVAVQRGKFLELIAKNHDFWGFDPEILHLLGIFSLLDAMLGLPMGEIVTYLPLDSKLKAALCREHNNEYLPLLQLAQYFEEARWEDGRQMIQQLNLDSAKVQAAFQASVDWANEMATLHAAQP
jgi:EAL and modified HD-GYP domain-containing signal transduction protein